MASIRKRTWTNKAGEQTAWVVAYTHQGKQHIKTFELKRDAVAWRAETQHEVRRGVHTPASASLTVAEAGKAWLEQGELLGLEESTMMQRRQHLVHIGKTFIAERKLAELAPADVQTFRAGLLKSGCSRVMIKKLVVSLGAILGTAMANGKVGRNVVREVVRQEGTSARRIEKRHEKDLEVGVDIPTEEEIKKMLDGAQGRWRPLIWTAIFTGLRASEIRGLRWDDVDLDRATLTVRQRADRFNDIGSPKSRAGKRTVRLVPKVVNILREWKLACPKGKANLVFPNGEGNVESLPNIHRRGLGALQVATGITPLAPIREQNPKLTEAQLRAKATLHPKYGLHSFRHAAASLFIEEGWTPKKVQTTLGHSSIQVTFDTYGHLFPSQDGDQAAMQRLQARLVG